MLIGYARVSTLNQNLDSQLSALKKAGCDKIFSEKISGVKTERKELNRCLEHLRSGDTLVIWKLDRLGRSLIHLIEILKALEANNISFRSLNDNIDTTTSTGKLFFHIMAAIAQFERDLISERTKAGLAAARAKGRRGGRPKGLSKEAEKTALAAKAMYVDGKFTIKEICDKLSISKTTLYKYLRHLEVPIGVTS